jgi:4-amino-4-deoxy-L-arabinose transferase-like glycosyltransferase
MAGEDNKGLQGPPETAPRADAVLIGVVVAAAILARAAAAAASGVAAPQEIRYIAVAQGLISGRGFEGIDTRFPDLIQPPLYPILIAGALLTGLDPVAAARGVSILMGSLLILPVHALTRRVFGPAAARRAAWLAAVYPLFVHISGLALTEPAFATIVAWAVLLLHRAMEGPGRSARAPAAAGALLGLGFLTRPEGLTYLAAACAILFLGERCGAREGPRPALGRALMRAALPAASFLIVVLPYSFWLHGRTERWLVAPKAILTQVHNTVMAQAAREGWSEPYGTRLFYERVKFGLNDAGTDLRTAEAFRALGLMPTPEGERRPELPVQRLVDPGHLARVVARNVALLYLDTIKYGLVMPTPLLILLALGATSRPLGAGPVRRAQGLLLGFALAGGSFVLSYLQPRFVYPSIAFLIPWMAEGWVRLEAWLATWTRGAATSARAGARRVISVLLGLLVAAASVIHVVRPTQRLAALWIEHRTAGLWLKEKGLPAGPVMSLTPVVAFYAGFPSEVTPYADPDATIRYARLRGCRYLVADRLDFTLDRPQLLPILDAAGPPADLRPLLDLGRDPEKRLVIYEILPEARGQGRLESDPRSD